MANTTPAEAHNDSGSAHPPLAKTVSATSQSSHKRSKSFRQETAKEFEAREKDPLAGHFAHLTSGQLDAAHEFHKVLTEKGFYTPASEKGQASHDETTLLRFLRARKFDVPSAVAQFSETEAWRQDSRIEQLYDTIDIEEYEQARSVYPQWTGRRDRRGIPLYLFQVGHLNDKTMSAYAKSTATQKSTAKIAGNPKTPDRLLRLFALYESMTHFVLPLCSTLPREHSETPVDSTNNIVDISGVGLKTFWNLKNHMQDASTLATAHYPETLDRIFIIGAPGFFPTVWGWIKRWFDPVTVSKIFILSPNEVYPTLEKYIEKKNIPKKYGGELEWEFGMFPNLDEDAKQLLTDFQHTTTDGWVKGPIRWVGGDGPGARVIAVGSVNGNKRNTVLAIPERLPVGNVINGETGVPPLNMSDTPGTVDADLSTVKKGRGVTSNGDASKMNGEKSNGNLPDATVNGQMEALAIS
ncbi:Patellin-3 [Dactylellina cionopaga]|nr:Patellin-3 [Dactylellina cionopaga]